MITMQIMTTISQKINSNMIWYSILWYTLKVRCDVSLFILLWQQPILSLQSFSQARSFRCLFTYIFSLSLSDYIYNVFPILVIFLHDSSHGFILLYFILLYLVLLIQFLLCSEYSIPLQFFHYYFPTIIFSPEYS